MKTIEHVQYQAEKAKKIQQRIDWLNEAKIQLNRVNIYSSIASNAKIDVWTDKKRTEINFQLTIPELAVLLQKRVDMNQKELDKLLNDF